MSDKIEGLSIGLSLDTVKVDTGLKDLRSKMTLLNSEMRTNLSAFDRGEKSIGKYQTKVDGLVKRIDLQKTVTEAARVNHEKMTKEFGEGSTQAEKAATNYNNQVTALNNLERNLEGTTAELKAMQEQQRIADSGWTKFGDKMESMGGKLRKVSDNMMNVGKKMSTYVTAPLVGFAAIATKTGITFSDSMQKVQAISGATGTEMEGLRDKAKEMGRTTKFSASEAAESMNFMSMAGWTAQESMDGLDGVMDLAAASGEDLSTVADIVTDSLSAFQLEAKDSGRMADVLAAAASNANTDVAGMGGAFKYVAPVAGALKFSIEDTSKAIGLLSNNGIKGEKAGTALRTMMTNLAKPTAAMKKEMDKLGISLTDSEGNMKSFDEIMLDMRSSFSGLTEEQQASSAATIFGKEAMSGALAIVNSSQKDYDKLSDAITNSGGAAKKMAEIMEGGLGGTLREIKSGLEGFAISIFEQMEPALISAAEKVKGFIGWLNDLSPQAKKVAVVVGGIAAAIGPVAIGLATMGTAVSGLMIAMAPLSGAILAAGGLLPAIGALGAGFLTLATGPVGIAVAAIAGIGIGTAALVNHLKKDAIPEVDHFGDTVSKKTKEALGGFMDLNDGAIEQLTDMNIRSVVVTSELAEDLKGTFTGMNQEILNGLKKNHEEQINEMETFFKNSAALSVGREQEILEKQKESNANKEKEQKQYEERAKEIIGKAEKEKRELTEFELSELDAIRQVMADSAIEVLTDNERDQKVILERMKTESGKITSKQAAETVKNSKKATEKVIEDAEQTYKDSVAFAIQQRDEHGAISEEEATAIIDDAKAKYRESTKNAEDTHKEVVQSAKAQAKEHVDEVDWETGEIKSKWEIYKTDVGKKVKESGEELKGIFKGMWKILKNDSSDGTSVMNGHWVQYKKDVGQRVKDSGEELKGIFSGMWKILKNDASDGTSVMNGHWVQYKKDVGKRVKDSGEEIKTAFSGMWTSVKGGTKSGIEYVGTKWSEGTTSVKNFAENMRKGASDKVESLRKSVSDKSESMRKSASGKWESMKSSVVTIASTMKTKAQEKFDDIVAGAKALPGRMKDGIVSMGNSAVDGIKSVGQKMANKFGSVVNGIIGGLNTVTGKLGIKATISKWTVPQFAKGTDGTKKAGPIIVGDKYGREIVEFPDGRSFLSPDTDTLMNAPKGTRVIPNKITEKYLKGDIPEFAKGAGVGSWLKDKAVGFKNAMSSIWDYAKNPSKLLDLMPLPSLGDTSGGFGTIVKGAVGSIKDKAVQFIKNAFTKSDGELGAKGGFPSPFRLTSRAGWRIHPIFGTRKFHYGDDWAAPERTRIPSRGNGRVVHTGFHNALGNYVDVQSGAYKLRYQHNLRNLVSKGDQVKNGETLGLVGSTGNSTGPHLHFETRKNGAFVAPKSLGFASGGFVGKNGMYNLAEEGHGEFVIPTAPNRRTDAMKLLALAGKAISGGNSANKRPNQLNGSGSGVFEQMLGALVEQTQMQAEQISLLTKLVLKDSNLYVDGNELGHAVAGGASQGMHGMTNIKNLVKGF